MDCTVQYTVVRAMARHRWRHSQYVGLTRVQLEHSRRRADREHQRQAREQAERRGRRKEVGTSEEDGAGALLPVASGVVRETGESGQSAGLICVRSLLDVCITTV